MNKDSFDFLFFLLAFGGNCVIVLSIERTPNYYIAMKIHCFAKASLALIARCSALIALALVPFTALADAAGDAVLAKSPVVSSTFSAYNSASLKIEQERIRAVLSLNEKFLVELVKAKSVALKSERLADANAIDAKIKEVTESNVSLKSTLNGKSEAVFASSYKGVAAKVAEFANKSDKLSAEQKKTVLGVLEEKLSFAFNSGSPFYFDKSGNLFKSVGPDMGRLNASLDSDTGILTYTNPGGTGTGTIDLTKIDGGKLPYTWKNVPAVGSIITDAERDSRNKAPSSSKKHTTTSSTNSEFFGKKVK